MPMEKGVSPLKALASSSAAWTSLVSSGWSTVLVGELRVRQWRQARLQTVPGL